MTTTYDCPECNSERILAVEDNVDLSDLYGSRVTCSSCESVFEADAEVGIRNLELSEPLYPGDELKFNHYDIYLPCCGTIGTLSVAQLDPRLGFVECPQCNKPWFVRDELVEDWEFIEVSQPPLTGDSNYAPCPNCKSNLGFSSSLVSKWDHLHQAQTFCTECRQVLLVWKRLGLKRKSVEYQVIEIPYGCPGVGCIGKDPPPITVKIPLGGGEGIHICESCNTTWQITEEGHAWIDLPEKPYRTIYAITICHVCGNDGNDMSYYTSFFPNNKTSAECRNCKK